MSEIDLTTEELILFSDLPKHLPKQPSGKKLHLSAAYRWKNQGICGVRLETIFVAGSRYTTKQALNRFWHRVTAAKDGVTYSPTKSAKKLQKQASDELEKEGW